MGYLEMVIACAADAGTGRRDCDRDRRYRHSGAGGPQLPGDRRAGHGSLALNWPLIGTFTAAAMIGTLAGSRVAGRADPRRLRAAFTVLVVLDAGYTLTRSLPGLA
jgi:hypothetical protein